MLVLGAANETARPRGGRPRHPCVPVRHARRLARRRRESGPHFQSCQPGLARADPPRRLGPRARPASDPGRPGARSRGHPGEPGRRGHSARGHPHGSGQGPDEARSDRPSRRPSLPERAVPRARGRRRCPPRARGGRLRRRPRRQGPGRVSDASGERAAHPGRSGLGSRLRRHRSRHRDDRHRSIALASVLERQGRGRSLLLLGSLALPSRRCAGGRAGQRQHVRPAQRVRARHHDLRDRRGQRRRRRCVVLGRGPGREDRVLPGLQLLRLRP